jgi:Rrf2 family iron-sulfur cluster assembly transcriptional regulator
LPQRQRHAAKYKSYASQRFQSGESSCVAHLETLLQGLVHAKILKGVRGPQGGYELARERRLITVGEIVRTAMSLSTADPEDLGANSVLLERVIDPAVRRGRAKPFLEISIRSRSNRCARRPRSRMCSTTRRSAAISLSNGATFVDERGGPKAAPFVAG